jgi:hypothetical protein
MIKVLHIGDIVGSPGRKAFARLVTQFRQNDKADLVVVNGENAAAGRGITPALAEELLAAGADVITLGDHTWDQKDIGPFLDREPRIVRPANFADGCPGRGWTRVETAAGPLTVISLIGRVFLPAADCPFRTADRILRQLHAEATSEKIAMGRYLDGRVTSVAGTHTHVQTSDETLLPKGTAYITDLGMTGPKDSVLGRDVDSVLSRFLTGMPTRFDVATDDVAVEGIRLSVNPQTGKAKKIDRFREML